MSTGEIVKDIGNAVIKDGGQAYFAYQQTNSEVENGYKIGNKFDWKWHALHSRLFGKQAYASKHATRKLLKWIDKIKPDVVHFHNLHSNFVNLNILCDGLKKREIPVVITLHDCWYFTGKCSHYVSHNCDKWQTTCGKCPQIKNEQPSLFFDKTKKVLSERTKALLKLKDLTLVGCSGWIADEAKKSKLNSANITVVRNGVDTQIFRPHESLFRQDNGINDEFVILGFADKWYNEKNREIVEKLFSDYMGCKFVIVGCKEEQQKYFSNFSNVLALGYVKDRQKLSDIYSSADVFVNLTRADTLPTVNMESICCGTPVITYNCGGSPELVDKECGIIVEIDDFDGLCNAIDKIKEEPFEFDVGVQQKKFDKNECYKKYLDVYKGLCEK